MPEVAPVILSESVTEALEMIAFMMAFEPEEALPPPEHGILAHIDFTGPQQGAIDLWAGREFTQMMTANVMGIDPDDPEAESKSVDAVKELVNIVAGILLTKLAENPSDMYNLTVPNAETDQNQQSWNTFVQQPETIILDVDGFPVAAKLSMGH